MPGFWLQRYRFRCPNCGRLFRSWNDAEHVLDRPVYCTCAPGMRMVSLVRQPERLYRYETQALVIPCRACNHSSLGNCKLPPLCAHVAHLCAHPGCCRDYLDLLRAGIRPSGSGTLLIDDSLHLRLAGEMLAICGVDRRGICTTIGWANDPNETWQLLVERFDKLRGYTDHDRAGEPRWPLIGKKNGRDMQWPRQSRKLKNKWRREKYRRENAAADGSSPE